MVVYPRMICENCNNPFYRHTSDELYFCSMIILRTHTTKPKAQWNGYNGDLELCPLCNREFSNHVGLEIMDCVKKLVKSRPN